MAKAGVLIAHGYEPANGINYINAENKREFFCYFPDNVKPMLKNMEQTHEFRAAYMALIFNEEARKQVPLISHRLSNGNEILIPIDTPQNEVERLIRSL